VSFASDISVSTRTREEPERSATNAAQPARLELQRMYGEQQAGFGLTLLFGGGRGEA
jgi:hypothetical protein